ncbi:MAG: long-chain fatty acid--CoA ligase [Pseudomonadota bacterium]
MKNFSTLTELVNFIESNYQNPNAFNFYQNQQWVNISTAKFTQNVKSLTLGLNDLGIRKNDGFAILAKPSPIWLMADLAAITLGAISVPIFPDIAPQNLLFEIQNAEIKFVFCDCLENLQTLQNCGSKFEKIIIYGFECAGENIIHFDDLLKNGLDLYQKNPQSFADFANQIQAEDLATIIYTSGSTGVPKGVEITHKNLVAQIHSTTKCFSLNEKTDIALSCLPLAHIFERMVIYFYISRGISIYFADDVKNVGTLLKEIKPTLITVVPRLLEKVLVKMQNGVNEANFLKKYIGKIAFYYAPKFAKDSVSASGAKQSSFLYKILNHLVYQKLRAAMGGNLRMIICGGAPLSLEVEKFFCGIGINLYVGYGTTESSPVIAVNYENNQKIGTVGKAFPDVQTKIDQTGELLAQGANIMRGYHKNLEKTQEVIDANGWLKTGDLASIDADGFIKIIGRKKEMFKTAGGKYVSPVPIEQKLITGWSLLAAACIIAESKKFVSCLLFVDFEILAKYKARVGLENLSDEDFLKSNFIKTRTQKLITQTNQSLNHWEQIQKFHLITKPISIKTGELTPSMKLRRNFVEEKFKEVIEGFYLD